MFNLTNVINLFSKLYLIYIYVNVVISERSACGTIVEWADGIVPAARRRYLTNRGMLIFLATGTGIGTFNILPHKVRTGSLVFIYI